MEITYTDAARQSPEFARLRQIADRLPSVVGNRFAPHVRAEWDVVADTGSPLYRLSLSDEAGQFHADFADRDLAVSPMVTYRLTDLWGDLLQVHLDAQHALVEKLSAELITE